jgi:type VII secretion-associated protein (TIGR03931 family)
VTGRAVLVGPVVVRSSHDTAVEHSERATQALASIDDELALVEGQPVAVAALWREVLSSTSAGRAALLVFPSWWSDRRVETLREAARGIAGDVAVARRAVLLAQSASRRPAVVVEIAESFVALTRPPDVRPACIVSREGDPVAVADEVARLVTGPPVVVDRADGVGGAADLGEMILARLRSRGLAATVIDDDRLLQVAESCAPQAGEPQPAVGERKAAAAPRRARRSVTLAAGVAVTGVLFVAVTVGGDPGATAPRTALLIEGHVVVEVPATWSARRVTAGPGSARLQVSSPANPHAAVHVTQSPVPKDETLQRTADTLRRALQAQPPGVFVDFDPGDRRGGRPAVTYREIRSGHDIRWTVLLDGDVRISVGCQSARGSESAVLEACERAISSARNIGEFAGTVARQP